MAKPVSSADYWFDEDAADRAVAFFAECLTHTTGEWRGQPFALSDWQAEIVRNIFGWKRQDGNRRYRTVFIGLPRKNGKTTLAAGLALYALYCDNEPGAQVINAAADREQAALCFDSAKGMVENEPELMHRSQVYRRSMTVPNTGSSYKVLSSEAFTKHGLSVSFAGIDELHAWPDRELYDVLTTSMGARRQPLTVITTTAGFDKHSLCYELWDYAIKVREGTVPDDSFLPVIFAADAGDDWTAPATWAKANPAFNVTVKEQFYAQECAKARALPAYENTFRRLYLNQWTESESRWLSSDDWAACGGALPDLTGKSCYAGLDLATTTDIAALVLAFPDAGNTYLLPFFFVPQEAMHKRVTRDRVPYDLWAQQGHIIATPGAVIDYDVIRRTINELSERYEIKEIAVDRWNAAQITTQLEGDGFEMVGFGQGFASLSGPTKELEARVIGQTLHHGDHPVLAWMASNVTVEQDAAGNMKPSKKKSTEKIDGIVATIMGIGRAMVANDQPLETEVFFV